MPGYAQGMGSTVGSRSHAPGGLRWGCLGGGGREKVGPGGGGRCAEVAAHSLRSMQVLTYLILGNLLLYIRASCTAALHKLHMQCESVLHSSSCVHLIVHALTT